jgi:hypothetical protein
MAEGLFNFVIAWTLLFAPLLFTDARRDRYKGSLDVLCGRFSSQMTGIHLKELCAPWYTAFVDQIFVLTRVIVGRRIQL